MEKTELQVPLPGVSDARRRMATNAPITLIVMVTGAGCSMFREMRSPLTPQKNGLSHLQTILCQPQAPKVVYSSTVQRQNKCCVAPLRGSLGLGNLAYPQCSSREGQAIKQKELQSLGTTTWWCSLPSGTSKLIPQHSIFKYLATFVTRAIKKKKKKMLFPSFPLQEK